MPTTVQNVDRPPHFYLCDPLSRQFPTAWRDIRFRRSAVKGNDATLVYTCPVCSKAFDHTDIDYLQGDHIWPYSLFGESSWANYQLICGGCNARKRAFVDDSIRRVLGDGTFRECVCDHLRIALEAGRIDRTDLIELLLLRGPTDKAGL